MSVPPFVGFALFFCAIPSMTLADDIIAGSCTNGQQASCGANGTALVQKKHALSNAFADLSDDQDATIAEGPDNSTKEQIQQQENQTIGTPDDVSIIVKNEPDNSSLEDKEANLEKAFNQFDKDGNGHLDVQELLHGLFSQTSLDKASAGGHLNTTAAALGASRAEVEAFVRANEHDNSMTLTLDEFKAAMADKAPKNTSLVQTRGVVDKCVSSWTERITVPSGCVDSKREQECWKTWEFWKGSFWSCRWKTVEVLVDCVKDFAKQAIAGFGDCFKNILDEVKRLATQGLKSFAGLIPKNCHDVNSCKNALLNAGQTLLDEIQKGAMAIFKQVLGSGPLGDAIRFGQRMFPKLPPLAKDLGPIVVRSGNAIVNFFKGSLSSIRAIADSIDICTPSGKGWFSFTVTDCGSFAALKHLFDNAYKLWEIPGNFESAVTKFGQCLIKNNLLSLPTPFLDVSVAGFCLPQFMQVPIKGIVGAFIYFTNQLKAAGGGCSGKGSEEPVCKLVQDMNSIGDRLAGVFTDAISLEQTSEDMNEALNGTNQVYRGDCAGADFKAFIEIGVGVTIPQITPESGGKVGNLKFAVGFELMSGCRQKKPFVDLIFGLGMDRGILQNPKDIEPSVNIAVGFDINTPQSSVVDVAVYAKIGGEIDVMPVLPVPAAVGIELGFKVLPQLDYPHGFKLATALSPEESGTLLQAKIDEAARDANSPEETVGSALGLAINHLAGANIEGVAREAIPQPQKTLRAGAFAMNEMGASMQQRDKKLDLLVGLEFKFCLTCHLWAGGGVKEENKPAVPRRRRDRRRRYRRRRRWR